jgi:hypothetical protein
MRIRSLLVLFPLLIASCGGADPATLNRDGYDALGSGNHAKAATHFHAALDAIGAETSSDQYEKAMLGLIEANVHEDPGTAAQEFIDFASATNQPSGEYLRVGGLLASARKYKEATLVLDAGVKAHPEAPALISRIEQVKADALKSGDTEAMETLEGLGYVE